MRTGLDGCKMIDEAEAAGRLQSSRQVVTVAHGCLQELSRVIWR